MSAERIYGKPNLTEFILNEQFLTPEATGELTLVLNDLVHASKIVSHRVSRAGIDVEIKGETGDVNVQGEDVLKLDDYANELFKQKLRTSKHIAGFASEEDPSFVTFPDYNDQKYVVSIDPLDGSSNFDVNVSIGTIFSIDKRVSTSGEVTEADFLQKGSEQVCAGYFLYGTSTVFTYTTGNGVNMFTLDPDIGEYVLSDSNIMIPEHTKYQSYSINEGYSKRWHSHTREFVDRIKDTYKSRYIGSMVADFHRNLLVGGVFMYPADNKQSGKLRYNFECKQLAMIAEQAGGVAIDGEGNRILDLEPETLHQRVPIVVGGANEVQLYEIIRQEHLSGLKTHSFPNRAKAD